MTLLLDQSLLVENEIRDFEVISHNASGILCKGGIVIIPKENYEHLAVDEYEYILMKYLEVKENKAEIPKTLLLKAKKTDNNVKLLGQIENYIFDERDSVYLDLLQSPRQT